MRSIFCVIFLLSVCIGPLYSQDFQQTENKIKSYVSKNQWDNVLIEATDLLIADPIKGDGYYYMALAFYKTKQNSKSLSYISKAESLDISGKKEEITQLKNDISRSREIEKFESDMSRASVTVQTAEQWHNAWRNEKFNLNYFINAVEAYLTLKKYAVIADMLNEVDTGNDQEFEEAIRIFKNELDKTPEMMQVNGYKNAVKQGDYAYSQGDFKTAISKFNTALSYRSGDTYANDMIFKSKDELAWREAVFANSIASFEEYLTEYYYGAHRNDAQEKLENILIRSAENSAKENDVKNTEYYVNYYLKKYPRGTFVTKANTILCNLYYKMGEANSVFKSSGKQAEALDYYRKTEKICASRYDLTKKIRKAKWKTREYSYPDRFFTAYVIDTKNYIGISIGGVNNGRLSGYASLRTHHHAFTIGTYWKSTSDHQFTNNTWDDIRFDKETRSPAVIGTAGFTYKIIWPLWFKIGAGVSYEWQFNRYSSYNDDGDYMGRDWVLVDDRKYWGVVPDAGIILDFNGFNLHYSFQPTAIVHPTTGLKMWHTFGIGFSL